MTNFCKSDLRRVINYTDHEPENKYDLWLSENLRYNSNGELVYDNPGLPACDLILKLYRGNQWVPIAGCNTSSFVEGKINIVKGVNYSETGVTGYQLNHLPLFRDPDDSPNELFDAGTLGLAINEYVTPDEWELIFNNPGFSGALNTNINNIDINLATYDYIGGINAQTDTTNQDYRGLPVVFGGPMVGLTYGGNTPTGFTLYGDSQAYNPNNSFLYVPGWALIDWLKDPTHTGTYNPFISSWKGIDTLLRPDSDLIWVGLTGLVPEVAGMYCRAKTSSTDPSGMTIEWVSATGGYETLGANSLGSESYVVKGGGKAGTYLNNEGEWTTPNESSYTGINLIRVNNGEIGIIEPLNIQDNRVMYLTYNDHEYPEINWRPLSQQYLSATSPLSIVSNNIRINGTSNSNDVLFSDGLGGVMWKEAVSSETITTILSTILKNTASIGWRILTTSNNPSISPEIWGVDTGNHGKYLRLKDSFSEGSGWDQSNNAIEWSDAIPNILMNSSISCSGNDIEISGNKIYVVDGGIRANDPIATLEYWNYYNVTNMKSLTVSTPPNNGNPIYIRIHDVTPSNITVSSDDIIDVNECLSETNSSDILLTRQFGIDKFELITATSSQNVE